MPIPSEMAVRLPILAELISRGDGSWILKPTIPDEDAQSWVTVREASKVLRVSSRTVTRWLGTFLVYRRPAASKYEVSLASVRALRQACNDPEFWENDKLQSVIREAVRQGMAKLVSPGQ